MQKITLDINPKGEIPVLYVAQYDNGRDFQVELVEGDQAYNVPEGFSVQLNVRKTDSKLVTKTPESIVDNIITFYTTEQMTACAGENLASVSINDLENHVITTLYFLIMVQRDVLAGGLDSASEIDNLTQQIEDIAQEVIGEDYYDKSEVNSLLAEKANISDLPDMSDYYDKSATDALLADKADISSLSDYAQKSWVSSNFINHTYLGAHYYNKIQVDALLYNMLPEGTASGAVASFTTEKAGNLTNLKCTMLASGGGGTPENPNPIVGFTECNITNEDGEGNVIDEITIDLNGTRYGGYVDVNNGKLVVTMAVLDLCTLDYAYYGGRFNSVASIADLGGEISGDYYVNVICDSYENSSSGNNNTFFVYSNKYIYLYNSDYTDAAAFKTSLSGVMLAYELATPLEIDISPEHLYANVGQNNVFHDCNGNTEVKYKDTIQHYIDTRI